MTPTSSWQRLAWLLLVISISGQAATPADLERAQREADRLFLEEQQRERERSLQLEERVRRPSGETLRLPEAGTPAAPGACRAIRKVVLDGAALLPEDVRAVMVRPFEGQCIGLPEINILIRAIVAYYVEHGYSTTRAYVPEQDLSQGELHILVIEGIVEDIRLEGSGVSIGNAFPGLIGKPFNLRDFEQGIDQINRLQSNNATLDIQPGSAPGSSIIVVKNSPGRQATLGASLDNTGTDATGYYQLGTAVGIDNLLGFDDYMNLSLRINPEADRERKLSQSVSAMFGIPYGRWSLTVNANAYQYTSIVHGAVTDFKSSGTSQTFGLRLDRIMWRDQDSKWTLSAGLVQKSNKNYINDELTAISSRRLTVAELSSNYTMVTASGLWSFDLGLSRGLTAFGALNDTGEIDDAAPRAQFQKLTYGVSLQRPFKLAEYDFSWQSSLVGQVAQDVLYGTEQFLVGSPYSVRGFRQNSLSGDSGWYLRNEVGMPLPLPKLFGADAPNGSIRPYLGYDIGHVSKHHAAPAGTLSGFTAGFNLFIRPLSFQLAYSLPVSQPERFSGQDKYVYARLSIDF